MENNSFSNVEKTTNIIKRYFYKFIDLPDQQFSEKISCSLALLNYLKLKNMCEQKIIDEIMDLRNHTIKKLNISVYKLDRRVNANDTTSYQKDKNTSIKINNLKGQQMLLKLTDIQEILFKTIDKVNEIVQKKIHENKLDDYWS